MIPVGSRPEGTPIQLRVLRFGRGDPKVFVGAAIHGNELTGLGSIWKLIGYLERARLKGSLTILPILNVEGVNYSVRGIPGTLWDLNRLYPGDPKGSLAERVTAAIWSIAREHDVIIDLHTAGNCIPFVLLDPSPPATRDARRASEDLAWKTGITVLDELPPEKYERERLARSLPAVAVKEGKTALTIELPSKDHTLDPKGATVGFKVLKNVLVALGIIEDTSEEITEYPVIKEKGLRRDHITSEYSGILEYLVSPGDRVKEGDVIAVVRDIMGRVTGEIKAEKDAYIIAIDREVAVWTGGFIAMIACR